MELGVMVHLMDDNIDARFKQVKDHGFKWCQLCCWQHDLFTEVFGSRRGNAKFSKMRSAKCEVRMKCYYAT